jgi:hypothetical protein
LTDARYAIANVLKHAGARQVSIVVANRGGGRRDDRRRPPLRDAEAG